MPQSNFVYTAKTATLTIMRRGPSNIFLAAVVGVLFVAVPIVNACLGNDPTLTIPADLLLIPGNVLTRPLGSSADLPTIVLASWVFYTAMVWPMLMIVRSSRQ